MTLVCIHQAVSREGPVKNSGTSVLGRADLTADGTFSLIQTLTPNTAKFSRGARTPGRLRPQPVPANARAPARHSPGRTLKRGGREGGSGRCSKLCGSSGLSYIIYRGLLHATGGP